MTSTENVREFLDQLKLSQELCNCSKADGEQDLPGDTLYKAPTEYEIENFAGDIKVLRMKREKS